MRLSTAIIPQSYYYRAGPVKLKLYLAPIPTITCIPAADLLAELATSPSSPTDWRLKWEIFSQASGMSAGTLSPS